MSIEPTTLEQMILRHKELYYSGKAEISDSDYDALEAKLKALKPDSSVLSLVGTIELSSDKVKHNIKMLSLNKEYDKEAISKWVSDQEVVGMFKIDGSSCSLEYKDGAFNMAKTRGNGVYGENITEKVRWIKNFPKNINSKELTDIKGEVYITDSNFYLLVEEMKKRGMDVPNSQRNIVAGLLGRKENISLCQYLSFQAFVYEGDKTFLSEMDKFKYLQLEGFQTPNVVLLNSLNVIEFIEKGEELIEAQEYLIDGLVFTYNDLELQKELGNTSHHPKYKMAFKYKSETAITKIKEIIWQVSKSGILTPVAVVKPVMLSGGNIQRVTLHNLGRVKEFNLKTGDDIEIIRSGEVIPKFERVIKSSKEDISIPTHCPSCENKLKEEDIRLLCLNPECGTRRLNFIKVFLKELEVRDISEKRIEKLLDLGIIKNIVDLYNLEPIDFLKVEGVLQKSADKFYFNLQNSKKCDLIPFFKALNLSGGCKKSLELLSEKGFNSLDKVLQLKEEDVSFLGEVRGDRFLQEMRSKKELIEQLRDIGFRISDIQESSDDLRGKAFCITGKLTRPRKELELDIKSKGGTIVSSVTSKTDYLVTNEVSTSSKYKKAQELGLPIINEEQLRDLK